MNFYKRYSLYTIFIFLFTSLSLSAQVTADFSGNIVNGCAPLVVQFSDLSTGAPTAWNWNFGNGNSSVSQNPSAIYATPGQYTVTLTASNASGSNAITRTNRVYVTSTPVQYTGWQYGECFETSSTVSPCILSSSVL